LKLRLRRFVQGERPLVEHAHSVGAHRARGKRRDLAREILRFGECTARLRQPLHESDPQRLVGRNRAACENEFQSPALADHAGQPDGAEVDKRHTEPPVEHAKCRVACGDAQVAPQRQLESPRDRIALDRRDHRLAQEHPGRSHGPVADFRKLNRRVDCDRFQVETGAEVAAGSGQNGDRQ